MPSEKELIKIIPKIYRNTYENLALFFFIRGQLNIFPTIKLKQAIANFRRETGITEDEWDENCIRTTYGNIQREFIDYKYTNTITKKNGKRNEVAEKIR
jgi:hypothetical protein